MKKIIDVDDELIPEIKLIAKSFRRDVKSQIEFWVIQGIESDRLKIQESEEKSKTK